MVNIWINSLLKFFKICVWIILPGEVCTLRRFENYNTKGKIWRDLYVNNHLILQWSGKILVLRTVWKLSMHIVTPRATTNKIIYRKSNLSILFLWGWCFAVMSNDSSFTSKLQISSPMFSLFHHFTFRSVICSDAIFA